MNDIQHTEDRRGARCYPFSWGYFCTANVLYWSTEQDLMGAWGSGIYSAVRDLMQLGHACNDETLKHVQTALGAYKAAYPKQYELALESYLDWANDR